MATVLQKIRQHAEDNPGKPFFSFEYFPPKTDFGMVNFYERLARMAKLNPLWVDFTWGAGGSTADSTMELCANALAYHGLTVMMHLTCTNMKKEKIREALVFCQERGIKNILALRGDPPKEAGISIAVCLIFNVAREGRVHLLLFFRRILTD
jgi:methylenetetrahydrofolate reductase (NADPH)